MIEVFRKFQSLFCRRIVLSSKYMCWYITTLMLQPTCVVFCLGFFHLKQIPTGFAEFSEMLLQTSTVLSYIYYHKIIGLSVPQLPFRVILYAANLKQFEKMNPSKLLILSLHEVAFEISISMRDEILGRRGFRLLRINNNGHFTELLIFPFQEEPTFSFFEDWLWW